MASPYRITSNFYPLLNSNYSKCSIVVTRLKSRRQSSREWKTNNTKSITKIEEFHDTQKNREQQAKRSVIVQLKEFKYASECKQFLESFGTVKNIFHYTTKLENPNMILVEYSTRNSVFSLLEQTTYMDTSEYIPIPTTILQYHKIDYRKTMSDGTTFPKYSHHYPTWSFIRSALYHSKSISEQMLILYKTLRLSDIDIRLRYYTAYQLNYAFGKLFPSITILPFGSSVSGFGQLGCDLDLICTFTNSGRLSTNNPNKPLVFNAKPFSLVERFEQQEFLKPLGTLMHKFIPGISNMQSILKARVPIIKFLYGPTSMHCDLSSNNLSGYRMSEVLYTLGIMDRRVKPLIFTIRKWAECNGVTSDTPGQKITNFSLTLLVVYYLQHKKILPSMNDIMNSPRISFSMTLSYNETKENETRMEDLLFGFFEYYATFDFHKSGICVRDGIIKTKQDISPLYIYNPLDLSLNVSRNITSCELKIFIDRVRDTLTIWNKGDVVNILRLIDPTYPKEAPAINKLLKEHYDTAMRSLDGRKSEMLRQILKDSEDETAKVENTNQVQEIIK